MNGNAQTESWNNQTLSAAVQDNSEIEQLSQQQEALREQIKQSEQNLNAQHTVRKPFM